MLSILKTLYLRSNVPVLLSGEKLKQPCWSGNMAVLANFRSLKPKTLLHLESEVLVKWRTFTKP
jgi:hypothetical protein